MKPTVLLAATLLSLSTGTASADTKRVASFDLGSLDTLDELGLGEHVVAVPKQNLPDYLAHYADEAYTDAGGLRSPDVGALRDSNPSMIVVTGRQNEWREEFESIAPVLDASLASDDYQATFDANVMRLAERLEVTREAEAALAALHDHLDEARQQLADAPRVLVATHNQGNLTLNKHPVVHEVLGLSELDIPMSVPSETRGERTFTRLSPEAIAEIGPDVLLIVDRSAAIGDGEADLDSLKLALAETGADAVRLEVLTPALWYLSGGGLQSLRLQVDDVIAALD